MQRDTIDGVWGRPVSTPSSRNMNIVSSAPQLSRLIERYSQWPAIRSIGTHEGDEMQNFHIGAFLNRRPHK
jgi:hypothetical protein